MRPRRSAAGKLPVQARRLRRLLDDRNTSSLRLLFESSAGTLQVSSGDGRPGRRELFFGSVRVYLPQTSVSPDRLVLYASDCPLGVRPLGGYVGLCAANQSALCVVTERAHTPRK